MKRKTTKRRRSAIAPGQPSPTRPRRPPAAPPAHSQRISRSVDRTSASTRLRNTAAANLIAGVLSGVVTGQLLALAPFLVNDALLVTQEINGLWTCEMTVVETSHRPYRGMVTGHVVVLLSRRTNVTGSAVDSTAPNAGHGADRGTGP